MKPQPIPPKDTTLPKEEKRPEPQRTGGSGEGADSALRRLRQSEKSKPQGKGEPRPVVVRARRAELRATR